jgi:RNA polymerase sigma-70 factor, ECF subfamily
MEPETTRAAGTSPSEHASRRERAVILAEVLEQLPGDYRDVLLLRQFEGLSQNYAARRIRRTSDRVQKL